MPILAYPTTRPQGRPGMPASDYPARDVVLVNNNPRTAQVATITYTGFNGTKSIRLDGVLIEASGGTVDAVVTSMTNAINGEPLVSGLVSAVGDTGADTVTITARLAGTGFTIVEVEDTGGEQAIAATTANAAAAVVPFGRAVVRDSTSNTRARIAVTGALTAKTVTITPTAVNDATYHASVTLSDGRSYFAQFLADASATVAEITAGLVARINNQMPANTVLATDSTTHVTLSAEIAGLNFDVTAGSNSATGTMAIAITAGGALTDIDRALAGVTLEDLTQRGANDGTNDYDPNQPMRVRQAGEIFVQVEDAAPNPTLPVFVGVGAGHEGKWRTTASGADYLRLSPRVARWARGGGTLTTNNLGVLALNL